MPRITLHPPPPRPTGTTKRPGSTVRRATLWSALTHKYVLDIHPGDVYFCTEDIGWVTRPQPDVRICAPHCNAPPGGHRHPAAMLKRATPPYRILLFLYGAVCAMDHSLHLSISRPLPIHT